MKKTITIGILLNLITTSAFAINKFNGFDGAFEPFCEECEFDFPFPKIEKPRIIQPKPDLPKIPVIRQQDIQIHKPPTNRFYIDQSTKGTIFNDALIRREFVNGLIIDCTKTQCDQPSLSCEKDENVN